MLPLLSVASIVIYVGGIFSSFYVEPTSSAQLEGRGYHLILSQDFDFGIYTGYYFYECDRFSLVCKRIETLPPRRSDQDWRDPVEPTLLADPSVSRIVVMWMDVVIYEYYPRSTPPP
ncbi:MAG: hypothetical protein FJ030_04050 [Chloroflexi bacterium]|nr:hypothetical protein [Chloroflexota bacterium]